MEELIKDIILNSDKQCGFIGEAEDIANVVLDLMYDGVNFNCDKNEVLELLDNNDILQISKLIYKNGTLNYFIDRIFDKYGNTMPDELETFYIDSNLLDCIDIEMLEGDIVSIEYEDCEYNEEEIDKSEDVLEERIEDLINKLLENKDCVHCLIKESLEDMYYKGYNDAIDKIQENLYEL
ncbi:hypothetical protein FC831_17150 [Clostridium botulinum]|nr:hypothetical protein [Clostridium botulinum]